MRSLGVNPSNRRLHWVSRRLGERDAVSPWPMVGFSVRVGGWGRMIGMESRLCRGCMSVPRLRRVCVAQDAFSGRSRILGFQVRAQPAFHIHATVYWDAIAARNPYDEAFSHGRWQDGDGIAESQARDSAGFLVLGFQFAAQRADSFAFAHSGPGIPSPDAVAQAHTPWKSSRDGEREGGEPTVDSSQDAKPSRKGKPGELNEAFGDLATASRTCADGERGPADAPVDGRKGPQWDWRRNRRWNRESDRWPSSMAAASAIANRRLRIIAIER